MDTRGSLSRRSFVWGSVSLASLYPGLKANAQVGCRFSGNPQVELLDDGRKVRLLERFEFIDGTLRPWPVPKGTVVDGASIPQIFWSIIGGPFEGYYRNPSIVHDYYCVSKRRKSVDVHRMFHEAMLCANVGAPRAFLMFEAVRRFGPTWTDPPPRPPECDVPSPNYNFDACTENAAPPATAHTPITRESLESFISEVESGADASDIAELRKKSEKLQP